MSDALRNATERSLVVVDEFGKGTESVSISNAVVHNYLGRAGFV